jgi:hypothetical protein
MIDVVDFLFATLTFLAGLSLGWWRGAAAWRSRYFLVESCLHRTLQDLETDISHEENREGLH